jgi:hypothetical protein
MLVIGLLITFGFLIAIILLFSYSKFHELLNDLKSDVDQKNEQNQKNLHDLKERIVEYDQIFKQFNQFELRLESLEFSRNHSRVTQAFLSTVKPNFHADQDIMFNQTKRLSRKIRQIDLDSSTLNTFLIEMMLNQKKAQISDQNFEFKPSNNLKEMFKRLLKDHATRSDLPKTETKSSSLSINQDDIINLLKSNILNVKANESIKLQLENLQLIIKQEILNQIESSYLEPILNAMEECKCPVNIKT